MKRLVREAMMERLEVDEREAAFRQHRDHLRAEHLGFVQSPERQLEHDRRERVPDACRAGKHLRFETLRVHLEQ